MFIQVQENLQEVKDLQSELKYLLMNAKLLKQNL